MITGRFRRGRDWWIPWVFVGFFAVVVAANAIMVVLAMESWSGLETEDAYRKGLAYNRDLEAAKRQAARGWRTGFAFEPTGDRQGRIVVTLADRAGAPLSRAEVSARVVRPTHTGYDFDLPFDERAGGRYVARTDFPLTGQWEIRVSAVRGEAVYRESHRVVLRP